MKPPNENYIIAICRNCGREYIKRLNNSTKQLSPGIRGVGMVNCSKKCSREYNELKKAKVFKLKKTKINNGK